MRYYILFDAWTSFSPRFKVYWLLREKSVLRRHLQRIWRCFGKSCNTSMPEEKLNSFGPNTGAAYVGLSENFMLQHIKGVTLSTLVLTSFNLIFVSTFLIDFLGPFKSTTCHPLEKEKNLHIQQNQRLKRCISFNYAPSLLRYFLISASNWQSCLCNTDKVQITAKCNVSVFQPGIPAFEHSFLETQLPLLDHPKTCSYLVFSNYVIFPNRFMTWPCTSISAILFF